MHGTEMSTAANYNIPVTFIVFNNGRLDMVDKGMKYHQRWRGVSEMNKDYEKGIDILKQMTDDEGMQTIKYLQDIFPDFEEKIVAFGFGQIYSRPNLELKLREVVTITALITQGLFDQLDFHIKAALKVWFKTTRNIRNHSSLCSLCRISQSV